MAERNWLRDQFRNWRRDWEWCQRYRDTVGFITEARESLPYWLWSVREILNAVRSFLNTLDTKAEVRMTPAMWRALYVLEEVARQYEDAVAERAV